MKNLIRSGFQKMKKWRLRNSKWAAIVCASIFLILSIMFFIHTWWGPHFRPGERSHPFKKIEGRIFSDIDKNKNHRIDVNEYKKFIEKFFRKLDENKDSEISFDELNSAKANPGPNFKEKGRKPWKYFKKSRYWNSIKFLLPREIEPPISKERILELSDRQFQKNDEDQDQNISRFEFRNAIKKRIFKQIDRNGDGVIDPEEFIKAKF